MKVSLIATTLCTLLSTSIFAAGMPSHFSKHASFNKADKHLQKKIENLKRKHKAKNVILFVGDGMGISTVTAARILEGQNRGESGEENSLSFDKFPQTALVKTYNTNSQTPDSAGTMTAMVTGEKTKIGVLSVSDDSLRADCASSKGTSLPTILELAEEKGKATGVVSTARFTHATPAATYAHSPERNWENNSKLPEEAIENGCTDIASQFIDFSYGDGIDVAMGGGRREFMPNTMTDVEGKSGKRSDGRDLRQEWIEANKYYPNGLIIKIDLGVNKIKK